MDFQVRSTRLAVEDKGPYIQDHKVPKRWLQDHKIQIQRQKRTKDHKDHKIPKRRLFLVVIVIWKYCFHIIISFIMRCQGLSKKAVDETIAKAFKVRVDFDSNVCHDKDQINTG